MGMVAFCVVSQALTGRAIQIVANTAVIQNEARGKRIALLVLNQNEQVEVGFLICISRGNRAVYADQRQRIGANPIGLFYDCPNDFLIHSVHKSAPSVYFSLCSHSLFRIAY